MISLADVLKTQQFTNPQTQNLGYNIIKIKIQNILLAIRQVNPYKSSNTQKVVQGPQGSPMTYSGTRGQNYFLHTKLSSSFVSFSLMRDSGVVQSLHEMCHCVDG